MNVKFKVEILSLSMISTRDALKAEPETLAKVYTVCEMAIYTVVNIRKMYTAIIV